MFTGMMWFDDNKNSSLEARITRAADYYKHKYGTYPNVAYVHQSAKPEISATSTGIEILTTPHVLANHFWIGIREAQKEPEQLSQLSFMT